MKLRVELSVVVADFSKCPVLDGVRLDSLSSDTTACRHIRYVLAKFKKDARAFMRESTDTKANHELASLVTIATQAAEEIVELKFQRNVSVIRLHLPLGLNRATNENTAKNVVSILAHTAHNPSRRKDVTFTEQVKKALDLPDADTNYHYSSVEFGI